VSFKTSLIIGAIYLNSRELKSQHRILNAFRAMSCRN